MMASGSLLCPDTLQCRLAGRRVDSIGDQIGGKVAPLVQDAQHLKPSAVDAVKQEEGEAVGLPAGGANLNSTVLSLGAGALAQFVGQFGDARCK